jgi:hypothetical protein
MFLSVQIRAECSDFPRVFQGIRPWLALGRTTPPPQPAGLPETAGFGVGLRATRMTPDENQGGADDLLDR